MEFAERIDRARECMRDHSWDLLVCALPKNVLMFSGYWPVVGTSLVCIDPEGRVQLVVPEDEQEFARKGWAEDVRSFQAGSLDSLEPVSKRIEQPLRETVKRTPKRIGCEVGGTSEPHSYVATHRYGGTLAELLREAFDGAVTEAADEALSRIGAVKTEREIERIRGACRTAALAFQEGTFRLTSGMEEREAAQPFMSPLSSGDAERAGGLISCMSGVNSGHAFGAFALSTRKRIDPGDLVLTHCNSYEDGYWTDITRTYVMGEATIRQREMRDAILEARSAALAVVRPGISACEVDQAARKTLEARGFGDQFKHSTGHGVGFGAIDANALPRLHPKSPDRLETGMVFNIEPGIYFPDYGGMRHCDMVALTESGVEVLTPFAIEVTDVK